MSSTSLIILAMYSTINVMSPSIDHLTPGNSVLLLVLLFAAASLALWGMFLATVPQRRAVPRGGSLPRVQRHFAGPGTRRR